MPSSSLSKQAQAPARRAAFQVLIGDVGDEDEPALANATLLAHHQAVHGGLRIQDNQFAPAAR